MDDSMATPIGQLGSGMPPPIYNVKKDHPPQGPAASYDEILNAMQPGQPNNPPASMPANTEASAYNPNSNYDPTCPPGYDPNPPAPYTQQPTASYEQPQYEAPTPYAYPQRYPPVKPQRNSQKPGIFGQYKDVIVIASAVFFLLFWAQPKARGAIPQLFSSSGGLNVLGMLAVGVAAGLMFRVGADYLPN